MDLIAERDGYGPTWTIGRLILGANAWKCCEQPWNDNKVGHSCIPTGIYLLKETMFYGGDGPGGKRDYPTWEIVGVPGRSQCKIHVANFPRQLEGCIAPGLLYAVDTNGDLGVAHSQDAFDQWFALMKQIRPSRLVVQDALKIVHHSI